MCSTPISTGMRRCCTICTSPSRSSTTTRWATAPTTPGSIPLLADEWAELGWNNVAQMQSFGMPGVFTHGDFDTWSPGYLMFLAAMHNGISRLYETFGNGGADTEKRILCARRILAHLVPAESAAARGRPGRSATTTTTKQTALLSTISYFSQQHASLSGELLPQEQALDSRSPTLEGPAAYVIPPDAAEHNRDGRIAEGAQAPACRSPATL